MVPLSRLRSTDNKARTPSRLWAGTKTSTKGSAADVPFTVGGTIKLDFSEGDANGFLVSETRFWEKKRGEDSREC
jgi:hypothetical protein